MRMISKKPFLKFVFGQNAGENFLLSVEIQAGETPAGFFNAWQEMKTNERKPLRALCILILLSVHRYVLWRGPLEVTFEDGFTLDQIKNEGKVSWINTLAIWDIALRQETNAVIDEKAKRLFRSRKFFSAYLRGSSKRNKKSGQSHAHFDFQHLSPTEMEFWKADKQGGNPQKMEIKELADYALQLEFFETEKRRLLKTRSKKSSPVGWLPLVQKLVEQTTSTPALERSPTRRNSENAPDFVMLQSPLTECYALEGQVGEALKHRLSSPEKGESWLIVHNHHNMPLLIDGLISKAITSRDVNVDWAFQSSRGRNCRAISSQWEAIADVPGTRNERKLSFLKQRKLLQIFLVANYGFPGPEMDKHRKKIRFYKTDLVHHFSAILFMPNRYMENFDDPPRRSACFVAPLPMHEMQRENRCALFLEGPSPLMLFYYNAIRGLFVSGIDKGILKLVDPLKQYRPLKKNR
jgi:hypothetical protein